MLLKPTLSTKPSLLIKNGLGKILIKTYGREFLVKMYKILPSIDVNKNSKTICVKNIECELHFINKYLDKEIFIFDYDHTIKLHELSLSERQVYEQKLYNILFKLKKQYHKKIYLVSYNLKPAFNNEYKELFEEIYIPKPTEYKEFCALQNKYRCDYMEWRDFYYRYIPKYIDIIEIANKNNVELKNVIFFDDNLEQITLAKNNGIHTVLVDPLKGIEL